jgi:hypothetical protein
MKKLAIFLAIMLIPFSAFALDTISDNDLDDVTGQAGVSIYTNSIQIAKTAVTTTYTDDGTNSVSIVAEDTVTQIFFGGNDPLMIDIVEMATLATELDSTTSIGMAATSSADYALTGVQITLPDSIQIRNISSTKSYYAAGTTALDDTNRFITIAVNGGTTVISHADQDWTTSAKKHEDQIKIILTAHSGDG